MKYLVTSHAKNEFKEEHIPAVKEEIEGNLQLVNNLHYVFYTDGTQQTIVAIFDATKFWVKEIK